MTGPLGILEISMTLVAPLFFTTVSSFATVSPKFPMILILAAIITALS